MRADCSALAIAYDDPAAWQATAWETRWGLAIVAGGEAHARAVFMHAWRDRSRRYDSANRSAPWHATKALRQSSQNTI